MLSPTISCPTCNTTLARNAYECPRCGHVLVKWEQRSFWFVSAAQLICLPVILALLLFVIFIITRL